MRSLFGIFVQEKCGRHQSRSQTRLLLCCSTLVCCMDVVVVFCIIGIIRYIECFKDPYASCVPASYTCISQVIKILYKEIQYYYCFLLFSCFLLYCAAHSSLTKRECASALRLCWLCALLLCCVAMRNYPSFRVIEKNLLMEMYQRRYIFSMRMMMMTISSIW